jgi:hypothetical protein
VILTRTVLSFPATAFAVVVRSPRSPKRLSPSVETSSLTLPVLSERVQSIAELDVTSPAVTP